jgi:hypothetical protein
MPFNLTIHRKEGQLVNEIMVDVIASAAYYGIKNMGFIKRADSVTFSHREIIPKKEYEYLLSRYGKNLNAEIEDTLSR